MELVGEIIPDTLDDFERFKIFSGDKSQAIYRPNSCSKGAQRRFGREKMRHLFRVSHKEISEQLFEMFIEERRTDNCGRAVIFFLEFLKKALKVFTFHERFCVGLFPFNHSRFET